MADPNALPGSNTRVHADWIEWARPRMFGAREVELFVNNFKAARSRDAFEPTGFDERPAC